jgi:hypothetical protein
LNGCPTHQAVVTDYFMGSRCTVYSITSGVVVGTRIDLAALGLARSTTVRERVVDRCLVIVDSAHHGRVENTVRKTSVGGTATLVA